MHWATDSDTDTDMDANTFTDNDLESVSLIELLTPRTARGELNFA